MTSESSDNGGIPPEGTEDLFYFRRVLLCVLLTFINKQDARTKVYFDVRGSSVRETEGRSGPMSVEVRVLDHESLLPYQ